MSMAAFDAQGQSDGSANTLRRDNITGPEHAPALDMNEYHRRMAHPAARAAVAKVRSRHQRVERGRRNGTISEDADLRGSSGFARWLGDSHAMAYRRQSGSKMPLGDLLQLIRRHADELDAVMNATSSRNDGRQAAASGNAPYRDATVSSASGI
jgi:hypothetical protein